MTMLLLLAQISDKATDPSAWSALVKEIGVGNFFVLILLILAVLGLRAGYSATFGAKGFIRIIAVDLAKRAADTLESVKANCERERLGQDEFRQALGHFAQALGAIGEGVHVNVSDHVSAIAAILTPRCSA
jgi:hypothetical protein